MFVRSFNTIAQSLPASIFCLSFVGAGWLGFALTRERASEPIIVMAPHQPTIHLGCPEDLSVERRCQATAQNMLDNLELNSDASSIRILSNGGLRDLSYTPGRLSVETDQAGRIINSFYD
ncbi:hypothetical protein FEM54_18230 [Pseudomonas edaphica]|uniref:Uncharacterized protein n=1 Tax=Pseudomonas edaphica TaxID=2006980 RepID=A0ABY2U2M7_9PSED|nr:hypothetical protein FEM54_18230 [Pseudomonas edaphica]